MADTAAPTPDPTLAADIESIDIEALRAKYREERDRRLRKDGLKQFVEVEGAFRKYVEDPDATPGASRAPLSDHVDLLVVGGGWSGMLAAVRALQSGIQNVRIADNGGGFGGTWYWNRYPGVQCDIESYIYMPLLEETGYVPKEKYSFGKEIREHADRVAKHFGLEERALFHTQITGLRWSDEDARWQVSSNHGDSFTASHVVLSCGSLNRPKLPGIPGILDFEGKSFHTSRWDYDYTGGDTTGNQHKLSDKRVALIGTGATGIQVAPFIAKSAEHLYVIQRTPVAVGPRGNKPTDPAWQGSLGEGWQEERRSNFQKLVSGVPQEKDLVSDGWTDLMKILGAIAFRVQSHDDMTDEERDRYMEIADAQKMNEIRSRVEEFVQSEDTAEALKPWYRFFCKRPTFNDNYLPMFNRSNVTLLDTQGRGVERITAKGLVINGQEVEVDCIIFATGFEVGTEYTRRAEIEVYGRDGLPLSTHWADDYRTLHGVTSNGYPNLYFMGPAQGPGDVNYLYPAELQSQYIARILKQAKSVGASVVEPTDEAVQAYVDHFREVALDNMDFYRECTPSYYNNEGDPSKYRGFLSQRYGGGFAKYREMVLTWLDEGMPGLKMTALD
ncbi:NAD(P)/FAD-dependent oxidoreductase [Oceanicola sp. 502str15]|uniref:flavin-containing monooxygenase n=1 Tax=Oceanicola sp. 502str15 TaxID=2696061 RepID=UPI002094818C|nr:NAD(P)/FAD-dependent oxidoreductase [Oceanicola sp. 502str15]MCO6381768.1 FAD-dependent oxidoreductase [Oceanicola sp. 502str15]